MKNVLAFCGDILDRLHPAFPEAIVAGGAIRDFDNDREDFVKDIDVVVFNRPMYLADLKAAMRGFQHRVAVDENVANYLAFENVVAVHEFWQDVLTPPIQIVVAKERRSELEILERHDFGLCQIGYDGDAILRTEAYRTDKANKTFTLVRCRDVKDYWRSVERYRRLETKYMGWKLVSPVEGLA